MEKLLNDIKDQINNLIAGLIIMSNDKEEAIDLMGDMGVDQMTDEIDKWIWEYIYKRITE